MNAWWEERTQREKTTLSVGSIVLLILVIYFIIWRPVANSITQLKQDSLQNQALLTWMQKADNIIDHSQQSARTHRVTNANERLSVVQTSLQNTPFKRSITQVSQTEQNNVRVQIKKAYFDDVSTWLVSLWQAHGIAVKTLNIRRLSNQGEVTANIILAGPQQ